MLPKIPDFAQVKPGDVNAVIAEVNALANLNAAPPLELRRSGGGYQLRLAGKGFLGAVTARNGSSSSSGSGSGGSAPAGGSGSSGSSKAPANEYQYTVQEVEQLPDGKWQYVEGGRVVTPAFEWNDYRVAVGTVVWVEPFGRDWRFDHGGGGAAGSSSSAAPPGCSPPNTSVSIPTLEYIECVSGVPTARMGTTVVTFSCAAGLTKTYIPYPTTP